jgi:hypothetical protein
MKIKQQEEVPVLMSFINFLPLFLGPIEHKGANDLFLVRALDKRRGTE